MPRLLFVGRADVAAARPGLKPNVVVGDEFRAQTQAVGRGKIVRETGATWICCQLGAREHYAVPRALHRQGKLRLLVTDAWVPPGGPLQFAPGTLSRRLRERFHEELADAKVCDFTKQLMARESVWRLQRRRGWDLFLGRNKWFQKRAVESVCGLVDHSEKQTILVAHSYAALDVLRHAKSRGWMTVLGQIDPGEEHYRIVRRLSAEWPEYGRPPADPPEAYFAAWREECELADRIAVNSEWAREALQRAGIPEGKLRVVPLAYEAEAGAHVHLREYPPAFTAARPLRVLFVGHASVAKGVPALLEAVASMDDLSIELRLVGESLMVVPHRFLKHPATRWLGPVPRSDVMRHCRECDVLVFPSLSDGFGMAQVEAQGWRLPVIASRFCGQVIRDGVNGIVLPEVTPHAIAAALRRVASQPELLAEFSRNANPAGVAGVSNLATDLLQLESM